MDHGPSQDPAAKRAKTEVQEEEEESLENGLALLVQNALSNVGDLVDNFGPESDEPPAATTEPMDGPPPELPRVRPSFSADPQAYVREMNLTALGSTVHPTRRRLWTFADGTGTVIAAHTGAAAPRRDHGLHQGRRVRPRPLVPRPEALV